MNIALWLGQWLREKGGGCGIDVSLPERLQLKLVETKVFQSGSVALRYLKQ